MYVHHEASESEESESWINSWFASAMYVPSVLGWLSFNMYSAQFLLFACELYFINSRAWYQTKIAHFDPNDLHQQVI